jgi:hypothetical protein
MKNILKSLHRGEEGMESIQVVMILAAAAIIICGIAWVWNQNKSTFSNNVKSFLAPVGTAPSSGTN